jgi:CRP/FNR family transcriptional regulator
MYFLGGIHHETSIIKAIAEEDVEILFIPIEHVPLLLQENKDWLDYIFKLYHKRFEELLEVINALAFQQMDVRILSFLKEKVALAGHQEISITHQQIADELATARVVVSRLLKQMEANGLVQLGRNKIVVL